MRVVLSCRPLTLAQLTPREKVLSGLLGLSVLLPWYESICVLQSLFNLIQHVFIHFTLNDFKLGRSTI